ncbi:hypothetical protein [Nocardioides cynanchi]|uniref:hypothetical protein n=1 Tax=Nocardioides cynanchi TaxID=2558918 RepID=UPI001248B2C5|nr:hypothetical protein [Nocardioides cynanchi]
MTGLAPEDVGPLPDGSHLLHIGPQKTGSTALQWSLHRQRAVLAEHGVVYPGPGVRPRYALGAGLGYSTPRGGRQASRRAWRRLLDEIADPAARLVCVSHEAFGRATDAQVTETVATLGGDRPHVLMVARRYDRLLPSQWQQRVKARITLSYDEWLQIALGPPAPDNPVWRNIWVPHDSVELARRWAEAVGEDNLTVLVADERDRTLLPSVVEQMLGVPPGLLAPGDQVVNRSLSHSEVELLRAVNLHFEERGFADQRYHRLVNRGLIRALVTADRHPDDPPIPPLPDWAWTPLVERSRSRVEGLDRLGVRVVGDSSNLVLPDEPPAGAVASHSAGEPGSLSIPLEVAARALDGLVDGAVRDRAQSIRAAGLDDPDPTVADADDDEDYPDPD